MHYYTFENPNLNEQKATSWGHDKDGKELEMLAKGGGLQMMHNPQCAHDCGGGFARCNVLVLHPGFTKLNKESPAAKPFWDLIDKAQADAKAASDVINAQATDDLKAVEDKAIEDFDKAIEAGNA